MMSVNNSGPFGSFVKCIATDDFINHKPMNKVHTGLVEFGSDCSYNVHIGIVSFFSLYDGTEFAQRPWTPLVYKHAYSSCMS